MGFRNPAVWMILILLIILLFGASRLPDITRNLGKSLKIFKEEVRDLSDEAPSRTIDTHPQHPTPPPEPPAPPTEHSSDGNIPPQAPRPGN